MNRRNTHVITTLLGLVFVAADAHAVVTARWVVDSYQDWDDGESEGVLVTSGGDIKPGWSTTKTALAVGGVWSTARGAKGALVVGTDGGDVYSIKKGKATKLATLEGAFAVTALAVGRDGTLYAGTMPGGQIWTISGRRAAKLTQLAGAETVWSLAIAATGDDLYAGTGPKGTLFAVDSNSGKARVAFKTKDKRIMSLAATRDGAIWLGTSEQAIVFRYDPKQRTARAIGDFQGNEVTSLAAHGLAVVAAVNEFKEPTSSLARTASQVSQGTKQAKKPKGESIDSPKVGTVPGAEKTTPINATIKRKGVRKGKGGLFVLEADGRLEQLHALTATYYASVAVTPAGDVLAGDGDKGRVYLVDGTTHEISTAFDVSERMVVGIVADEYGTEFTTADGAAVYAASGAAASATYTSSVRDLKTAARFGRFVWRGDGNMNVQTRTGNTAKPDIGWSSWASLGKRDRHGKTAWGAAVVSPPGRYVQFRVRFSNDKTAAMRTATLYHLPQNRPTQVKAITLKRNDDKPSTLAISAKSRSPMVKISWQVDNPDKDSTHYALAVRRDGNVNWRPLPTSTGKPLTSTSYQWNIETFPDGYYHLRVTARDAPANPPHRVLTTEKITELFLVDNERPAVTGITVRFPSVAARATDNMSAISEASFSVDDGPWQLVATKDGLFDEQSEILSFELPAQRSGGIHTLAIRVADEAGNIGSNTITFRSGR